MTDDNGTALVEFAIALPVIVLLLFGTFQIVLLLSIGTLLDHAAFEGARTAAVLSEPDRGIGRAKRVTAVIPRGPGFLAGDPTIKVEDVDQGALVQIEARVVLLPGIKQATQVAGSDGTVELSAAAWARREPWAGY